MGNIKIREEMLKEVGELINIDKGNIEEQESSIIFDGKQYTLKIPKRIAELVGINPNKDKFVFQIQTFPIEKEKKPVLIISLKRGT